MSESEIANSSPSSELNQTSAKPEKAPISFSIWPPTQRTRDAVVNRLIETLSTPSVLSKRYGTLLHDEASSVARQIEEEAFAAAGGSASAEDDGIEILQAYSKEISKRMLDAVKSRSVSAPSVENPSSQTGASEISPSPADEATSVAEAES